MPTETITAVSQPKRRRKALAATTKPSASARGRHTDKVVAAALPAPRAGAPHSKQQNVLALLNRPDGATIVDLIEATGWQQHSVRGFLAGTVKKKLGLTLTSSKEDGDLRRYHIVSRRSR